MQNITLYLLFLFIVTGLLFTACSEKEITEPEESTLEESASEDSAAETEESTLEEASPLEEMILNTDTAEEPEEPKVKTSVQIEPEPEIAPEPEDDSVYEDGSYQKTGAYTNPAGPDSIGVTLTIKDDVVTGVGIRKDGINETTKKFQTLFAEGISALVVGKRLDEIGTFSSVNGSSLTPKGFRDALEQIKAAAQG